ncbi:hypothetical protein ACMAY5_03325 [Arenicellales bacterium nBUS_48]|nr:hypothetical protein [Pseudomonadota bacterium]
MANTKTIDARNGNPCSDAEVCESCGGQVRASQGCEVTFGSGGFQCFGMAAIQDQKPWQQKLCWSCMNDAVTSLISN